MSRKHMRSNIRLRAGDNTGSVILRRLNTPLILCDLRDISEMGCRCVTHLQVNDELCDEKWRSVLAIGETFQAEIAFEPYIPRIYLPIEIRSSLVLSSRRYELGIAFNEVNTETRQMLKLAMIGIATEKLRLAKSNLQQSGDECPGAVDPAKDAFSVTPRSRISAFTSPLERPSIDLESGERRAVQMALEVERRERKSEPRLGEILSRIGMMSRGEVANAVFSAREKGVKLGEYLVGKGVLTPLQLLEARSVQTGLAYVDFPSNSVPAGLLNLFPIETLMRFNCVPFEMNEERVRIACTNPLSRADQDTLERYCDKRVELHLCREDLPAQLLIGAASALDPQRRSHPRFRVSLPASFQCTSADGRLLVDAKFASRIIEISDGGMKIIGPVILGIDPTTWSPGQLKLIVTIGAVPHDIVALCQTRHLRFTLNPKGCTACVYGLQLDNISREHRDIFQGMVAGMMQARPTSLAEFAVPAPSRVAVGV
jgi:hypothetical protein